MAKYIHPEEKVSLVVNQHAMALSEIRRVHDSKWNCPMVDSMFEDESVATTVLKITKIGLNKVLSDLPKQGPSTLTIAIAVIA